MPHWDDFVKQPNVKVMEEDAGKPWLVRVEGKVFVTRAVYMTLREATAKA